MKMRAEVQLMVAPDLEFSIINGSITTLSNNSVYLLQSLDKLSFDWSVYFLQSLDKLSFDWIAHTQKHTCLLPLLTYNIFKN